MDLIKLPFQIVILILREVFDWLSEGVAESITTRVELDNKDRNEKLLKAGIKRVNGKLVFPDHSNPKS